MRPVRHELGIRAFGVNSWLGRERRRPGDPGARGGPGGRQRRALRRRPRPGAVRGRGRRDRRAAGNARLRAPGAEPADRLRRGGGHEDARGRRTAGQAYDASGWEVWAPVPRPVQAGDYEGVIAKGREAIEASPLRHAALQPRLLPRAWAGTHGGRDPAPADGGRALAEASARWRGKDSDFDAIRDEPGFKELVA